MLQLLTLIGAFFSSVAGWFASSISRKAIVVFAVITAFVALIVAFLACMKIIIAGLVALIVMPAWVASWIGMFIPSNYTGVIASIMSAKTCKAAYNLAVEKVKLIGQST